MKSPAPHLSFGFPYFTEYGKPHRRTDENQVQVTISHGFWMGKYEVTQGEWSAVMGEFPREQDKGRGPDLPVYWVSWVEAKEFCRRVTARARESRTLPAGWEVKLPTEAQWEYACRAGTSTATSFGPRLDRTQANIATPYPGSEARVSGGGSVKVGSYPANAWNLHDMHGSVWEWCRDWYYRRPPGGAMRLRYEQDRRSDHIGFRVAAVRIP